MRRLIGIPALLALAACAGGGGGDGDGPDQAPNGDPLPACDAFRFEADAMEWQLPFPLVVGDSTSDNVIANGSHALLDLDGDGLQDFVVVRDDERDDPDPLVGRRHWLVFANTGSGFATSPTEWALPFALEGGDNALGTDAHALVDLDGDGKVDFVVNDNGERPEDDDLLGTHHWLVYANTGSGFAETASEWSLPFRLDGSENVLSNADHTLLSLTGEGGPDLLVIVDSEREEEDALVGRNHWLRFANTGSGFAAEPQEWTLPFPLRGSGFDHNALSTGSHTVLDLDGDAKPDFLVHRDDERDDGDVLVGKNHWLVFENTGSGFATDGAEWSLPFPLSAGGWDESEPTTDAHALLDASGDARIDFVSIEDEREDPDALVGKRHWAVYANTGSGFAGEPEAWELPYPLEEGGWSANEVSTTRHVVIDLDGDALPDFVEVNNGERDDADPLLGKQHWRVHRGACE